MQYAHNISSLAIPIAILVCSGVAIVFSNVATDIKRRWAFWVVVSAIVLQLGLNITEALLNQRRLEAAEEQLIQERKLSQVVREDLARSLQLSESQEKLIEAFREEFHSENHARKDASALTEELRLKNVEYESLRISIQHQLQFHQLEVGLLSKEHYDECTNEWMKIGGRLVSPGASGLIAPIARYVPQASYPEEGRNKRQSGTVVLAGTIMPSGAVCDVGVTKSLGPGFDEEAIRTVYTWKFDPATQNGLPVAVSLNFEIDFRHLQLGSNVYSPDFRKRGGTARRNHYQVASMVLLGR